MAHCSARSSATPGGGTTGSTGGGTTGSTGSGTTGSTGGSAGGGTNGSNSGNPLEGGSAGGGSESGGHSGGGESAAVPPSGGDEGAGGPAETVLTLEGTVEAMVQKPIVPWAALTLVVLTGVIVGVGWRRRVIGVRRRAHRRRFKS